MLQQETELLSEEKSFPTLTIIILSTLTIIAVATYSFYKKKK
jgi:hypothetical protein